MNQNTLRYWALFGLGLGILILNLDITILNVALPVIGQAFKTNIIHLQWINNIYLLAFSCIVITVGRLSDIYGAKKIYCIGTIIFFLGSLISGAAPNTIVIMIGRSIQGLGMAMVFPMAVVLGNEIFPPKQRAIAVGVLITFTGVGQALGPTIGGFITEYLGWRYAFFVNLPICIISFLLIYCASIKAKKLKTDKSIHIPSIFILSLTLILLMVSLNQSSNWGFLSFQFLSLTILAFLLLIGFIVWQHHLKSPLVNLSIYHNETYRVISIIRPIFQFNFTALIFIVPLYLQNILEFTPSQSGIIILMSTFLMAITGPTTGKIIKHIGVRKVILIAQTLSIIAFGLLLISGQKLQWSSFIVGLIFFGIYVGIMFSATNYTAVNSVPERMRGMGYAVFVTLAFYAAAVSVAISGSILSVLSYQKLILLKLKYHAAFNPQLLKSFTNGAHSIKTLHHLLPEAHVILAKKMVVTAFVYGYHTLLIAYMASSFIGLITTFFLKEVIADSNHD